MGEQDQVLALTARRGPVLPGEVAARADVEDLAQTLDGELSLRRIDELELHRRPSLTKKAVARFRISRSWRSTSFSRRKRLSSAAMSSCRSAGGASISRSRRPSIQLRKVESSTPRSAATARRERPLVWARRTASPRNSGVNCFLGSAIGGLLLHGKSSPLLRGKSTNAGLKRMASAQHGASYRDLLYVRRRYITAEQLREAIAAVTNATLRARDPLVWGEGTNACASDSKHFGAWDQNLTTQWHVRYGGRGGMIYWHVERRSLCIHSQLKSPSSSEVASMIEGVLRHCTELEVDRQYVDSHGQSVVAFAFTRLLGFHLLPRLKAIHAQRLYRPEAGEPDAYPDLQPVLSRPIDWDLIRRQYDEMVKYATALRLGTAEAEAILRRFTRENTQHPTYKALSELGKAVKTAFLARYLADQALRREVNDGLNVVEQWNSANDFIFFARRGEVSSNRREDQELSMLGLHLLQNCMVYVNTLMVQQVLARPEWQGRLTARDLHALTPLFWGHVNPYGRFELDMATRIAALT